MPLPDSWGFEPSWIKTGCIFNNGCIYRARGRHIADSCWLVTAVFGVKHNALPWQRGCQEFPLGAASRLVTGKDRSKWQVRFNDGEEKHKIVYIMEADQSVRCHDRHHKEKGETCALLQPSDGLPLNFYTDIHGPHMMNLIVADNAQGVQSRERVRTRIKGQESNQRCCSYVVCISATINSQ